MPTTAADDDATIYYEVNGTGEPMIIMGGWGTFCHGKLSDAPRAIVKNYQVLTLDYRGIGESTDVESTVPSTQQYADDVLRVCDELGWDTFHFLGMVGMGACVGQEIAIRAPERVRSLVMTGTWAICDKTFVDELVALRNIHLQLGFPAFQELTAAISFEPGFYQQHRERVLGPTGAWSDLDGRASAHARLIDACLAHDVTGRMGQISAPTFVVHAGSDILTGPRLTVPLEQGIPNARGHLWPELAHIVAGKEQKIEFDELLMKFLAPLTAAANSIA